MKVLMYGWEFPPNINGGLGVACYEIVRALLKKSIHIDLILPKAKPMRVAKNTIEQTETQGNPDLTIQFVDSMLQPYMDEKKYRQLIVNQIDSDSYGYDLFSEVERYARQAGPYAELIPHDVIHVHDWLTIRAGILAKKTSKKPLFFHVHSLETARAGEHINQAIFDIEREGLEQADKIFAVSQYTRDQIIKYHLISPDKIVVVYNGIPHSYYTHDDHLIAHETAYPDNKKNAQEQQKLVQYQNKSNLVLFLGRVTYQKGPFHFIDAAYKILSVRKDIHFAVAGDGDLLHDLIEYVAKLQISSHVQFLGFLDKQAVQVIYERCKVYVMPSVSEPFGLTCLEALIRNVPVIVSRQSGVSEVLGNVLTIDAWDTLDLAGKIIALVDYPIMGLETIKNSQHDLSLLTWDSSAKTIVQTYHQFTGV